LARKIEKEERKRHRRVAGLTVGTSSKSRF